MVVLFTTVKLADAVPPKVTLVAPVRFVPVIVTVLPPESDPELGATEVIVGDPGSGAPGTKPPK
jgi:hypothetical protein